ncbi:myoglobin, partial [Elysia marginata]
MSVSSISTLGTKEKRVLKSAWKKIIGKTPEDLRKAGINLVLWMLDNIPNMRMHFTQFQDQDQTGSLVMSDELFLAHSHAVILALDSMYKLVDNPARLEQHMITMARYHLDLEHPIGSEYFD